MMSNSYATDEYMYKSDIMVVPSRRNWSVCPTDRTVGILTKYSNYNVTVTGSNC